MKLGNVIMAIAFASFALITGGIFITGFEESYNQNIDTSKIDRLSKMSDIEDITATIQKKIDAGGLSAVDTFVLAAQLVFEVVKLLVTSPIILASMVLDFAQELGVPPQVTLAFLTIVTLALLLAVIRVFKGVGGGDI